MNHDLISVRYHGNLADPETERARQRIHWMCAQAKGTDVLDLGCSQGIVTLILAREGFRCTGVDVEESSLDTARTALAKEAELVRNRAQFQIADATQLPFNDASFDTVIVGEVLEHLTQPSKILDEARRMLRPGGRLVITVPYGLNAYHDHKYSYYPISLLSLLEPRFRTVSIGTLTNYIVYVGTYDPTYDVNREPKGDRFDEYLKLEQGLEARCIEKERDLYELGTKLYGRIKILSAHTGNQAKEIRELRENLSTEKKLKDGMLARITEADAVRLKFGEIDSARLVAQQKADELRQEVARLKQQLGTLEDNHLARARQQERNSRPPCTSAIRISNDSLPTNACVNLPARSCRSPPARSSSARATTICWLSMDAVASTSPRALAASTPAIIRPIRPRPSDNWIDCGCKARNTSSSRPVRSGGSTTTPSFGRIWSRIAG